MHTSNSVKLILALAFAGAIAIAMLLPVPRHAQVEAKSTIPQVAIGH